MATERWLADRHAIVTGGSRGLGAAIAAALAERGARVTVLGRDRTALEQTAVALRTHDVPALALVCDVSAESDVRAAFTRALEVHGDPYVLVNNAGQAAGAPFLDTTRDVWDRMIAVNLTAPFLCVQQVLAGMLERRAGRIINVASTSGLRGYRNVSAYTAAKHGLVGLTRALAAETVRHGITVNALCPAYADTDMARAAAQTVMRDLQKTEAEAEAVIARTIQRGTLIEPREVASAAAWLCSPDATGITGQAIVIAGGEF
jgi:NAD(P)-dependent dehydrogenase (short-subunit alcohol dehydrogenase family)